MDFRSYWLYLVGKNPQLLSDHDDRVMRITVVEFKRHLDAAYEQGQKHERGKSLLDRLLGH